jgi:hypothetical protein
MMAEQLRPKHVGDYKNSCAVVGSLRNLYNKQMHGRRTTLKIYIL